MDADYPNNGVNFACLSTPLSKKGERDAAQARVSDLQRLKETLDQSESLLADLNTAKSATKSAADTEAAAGRKNTGALQALSSLRDLQKQRPQHARALQGATASLTALERESEALGRFETAVTKRDHQAAEVDRLTGLHAEALKRLSAARTAFQRAERDLTEIQALHVARNLAPGEPCPACGALDHPNPATGDPERRGRHDEFERTGSAIGLPKIVSLRRGLPWSRLRPRLRNGRTSLMHSSAPSGIARH